ncbi:MAG: aminotransferase class V-fold PLP-dependent enzyme, partial [Bacteroidales bacterium]|nr:aminotransferase class V-fold PLP-dependent enzyme [Bacteroidales bacterium]
PMGVGILYGKEKFLEEMVPYQTGGEMIKSVTTTRAEYNELPFKFEAGTPNVADVLGLETAIFYLESIGREIIHKYESELYKYAVYALTDIRGVKILGDSKHKSSVISFNLEGIHPYDAGTVIDRFGIAVRTGHHCAQPLIDWFGIPGTIRASFAFYNTREEIDKLCVAVRKVIRMFE